MWCIVSSLSSPLVSFFEQADWKEDIQAVEDV